MIEKLIMGFSLIEPRGIREALSFRTPSVLAKEVLQDLIDDGTVLEGDGKSFFLNTYILTQHPLRKFTMADFDTIAKYL